MDVKTRRWRVFTFRRNFAIKKPPCIRQSGFLFNELIYGLKPKKGSRQLPETFIDAVAKTDYAT
jgi:hypothetical protein